MADARANDNLPALIAHWPQDARDHYEEKAAIIEYDGNQTREYAEFYAELATRIAFCRAKAVSEYESEFRKAAR